jgi:hypothetical protein
MGFGAFLVSAIWRDQERSGCYEVFSTSLEMQDNWEARTAISDKFTNLIPAKPKLESFSNSLSLSSNYRFLESIPSKFPTSI